MAPVIIPVAPVVTAEDETNNNQAMAVEVPAVIPPPRYQAQRHGEAALPPEPPRRNVNAERWRQPPAFNTHIANNNGNIRGNDRGTGNNVQQTEPIQDSDATCFCSSSSSCLRSIYQKPYPAHINDIPFPRGFKVPNFNLFNGEDLYPSALEHIRCFLAHCVAIETQPLMKLRLVGSSLSGQAFTWYLNLPQNSIQDWNEMETVFIDQYYRSEPEITINDLTCLK
ncbi:PREDICTED: retrotransposon [Prunus dulcis]|uniref:PREDICTED: retrotransposon n=1 Tax=Prunus dulcis TaxID=3755 RepID=A0A5E4GC14_PRUDU|nr:hypothetical protein L3X38_038214 [Prunus dulcis]VVA37193.1 PREDICTED: retrotransposon [Prunus dulcis]